MKDDLRLPEESMKRIEDHLERMEAEIEQRVEGMKKQAIGATVVMGVLIMFLVYLLVRVWDKL